MEQNLDVKIVIEIRKFNDQLFINSLLLKCCVGVFGLKKIFFFLVQRVLGSV